MNTKTEALNKIVKEVKRVDIYRCELVGETNARVLVSEFDTLSNQYKVKYSIFYDVSYEQYNLNYHNPHPNKGPETIFSSRDFEEVCDYMHI